MKTQEQLLSPAEISVGALTKKAISLLEELIAAPSFSKEENATADLLQKFLRDENMLSFRKGNNVWARNKYYSNTLPTVLLNSHHDTVKPNAGYTVNPFAPSEKDGKLFGLGSNDAGGALVSLLATFLHFYEREDLPYNLIFVATAEEEISGAGGIESVRSEFGEIEFAIVGEPTQMDLAIAEKGLLVLDCVATGTSSHAAHENSDNAITNAMKDIQWFNSFSFPKRSEWLGEIKMSVTMIRAGTQHNVIPPLCTFTVDIRTTDAYTNEDVLKIIRENVSCAVNPRSTRLKPSSISISHPFVKAGIGLGRNCYGSPAISDQALMNFPSVKIGPGDSKRSHSADEFIYTDEIKQGIDLYIKMLSNSFFA